MKYYKSTKGISKKELMDYATAIRKLFELNEIYLPVVEMLDMICQIDESFSYVISDDETLFSSDNKEVALYDYTSNRLYIPQFVYEAACENIGKHRFTIAHEISHYFLMNIFDLRPEETNEIPKAYENPEWQADNLAGFLLIPHQLTKDMEIPEIVEKCKVSEECAIYQKIRRQKMLIN